MFRVGHASTSRGVPLGLSALSAVKVLSAIARRGLDIIKPYTARYVKRTSCVFQAPRADAAAGGGPALSMCWPRYAAPRGRRCLLTTGYEK